MESLPLALAWVCGATLRRGVIDRPLAGWSGRKHLYCATKALVSGIFQGGEGKNLFEKIIYVFILCQIDFASSLSKNSKLCVFLTNKHESLRRQPVTISTPTHTQTTDREQMPEKKHTFISDNKGDGFFFPLPLCIRSHVPFCTIFKVWTPHPLQLLCLNQFFLTWRGKGRERKEEADSSRRLRSRARIVPAGDGRGGGGRSARLNCLIGWEGGDVIFNGLEGPAVEGLKTQGSKCEKETSRYLQKATDIWYSTPKIISHQRETLLLSAAGLKLKPHFKSV